MNNSQVIKAFTNHLDEFMEDVLRIYPDNKDILRGKLYFTAIRKAAPGKMVQVWKTHIAIPYENDLKNIDNSTMDTILNKDYKKEIKMAKDHMEVGDAGALVDRIKDLLKIVKEENIENSIKALTYIRNLCKISKLYN